MNILFCRLYKIDVQTHSVEEISLPEVQSDMSGYITQLIEDIASDTNSKEFRINSDATEVIALIRRSIEQQEYVDSISKIANRLLRKETETQENMNLPVEIHKGMLIISMIQITESVKKFIISKAEYSEIIDETSYQIKQGPPIKKKIYKAFTVDIATDLSVSRIFIYDTNTTMSKYWWRDFLELSEINTNEKNTITAFSTIDTKVLTPLRDIYPQDYVYLRNSVIRYFRASLEFRMDDFLQNGIGNYIPFDSRLNMNNLKNKIMELPSKYNFDTLFEIIPGKIRAKFVKDIKLTDQIDLRLKQDIENIENVISAQIINGKRYVLVESEVGYEFFKH